MMSLTRNLNVNNSECCVYSESDVGKETAKTPLLVAPRRKRSFVGQF